MRRANLVLLSVVLIHCGRPPGDLSPWGRAQRGTLHVQADLTSALDKAAIPSEGVAAPPSRSVARIEGVTRSGVYMQTPGRARFPVFIHPGGFLVAWAALIPSAWSGSTDGAEFRVSVIGTGAQDSVLLGSVTLNPRANEKDRRWERVEYPLRPWAGTTVWIELAVDPGPAGDSYQDWCIWGEPVVCSPPLAPPQQLPQEIDRQLKDGTSRLDWCFTAARAVPAQTTTEASYLTSAFDLAGERREGMYAHPPWSMSATVVPGARARFLASLGMVQSCHEQSDGVMIRVVAAPPEGPPATLFEYWLCPRANLCDRRWVDIEVPLLQFGFRPVTITVETSAGLADNLECDSVTLGSLRIVSTP